MYHLFYSLKCNGIRAGKIGQTCIDLCKCKSTIFSRLFSSDVLVRNDVKSGSETEDQEILNEFRVDSGSFL